MTDLFEYARTAHAKEFGGSTYDEARDGDRLKKQLQAVRSVMLRSGWVTLKDLAEQVGAPESSVSARLRDLRKLQFGGYRVDRRYVRRGLWEYRIAVGENVSG